MQATELPASFWAPGPNGFEQEYYFVDAYGQRANFIIDKGGAMKINTSDPNMAHNYESLKAWQRRTGSSAFGAEFKLVDLEKEAESNVSTRQQRVSAMVRIDARKSDLSFVASLARRLGLASIALLSSNEVLDYVQQRADEAPGEVLEILDNVYQQELFELDKARESQIIIQRNGFYYYGQHNMGPSEGAVINWFHNNGTIYNDIVRRNAQTYGTLVADDQKRRVLESLEAAGRPLVTNGESILGGDFDESSTADTPMSRSDTVDNATKTLLQRARAVGIVSEEESDAHSRHLAFTHIALVTPNGPSGFVAQALAFLANPANKGVRRQIEQATTQVERAEKQELVEQD